MTSLSEVYRGEERDGPGLRRLYLGTGLFLLGSFAVIAGIVAGATDLLVETGMTVARARETAGVLAGLGVPAVFLGVFTVLPAGRRTRAAAVIGATVAVFGVALFSHAYPCQWVGTNCAAGRSILTLHTAGVYFFGVIATFWCLFAGVANFKTRNDPGGTVRMEVTKKGETRVVEVPRSSLGGLGGVGLLGNTPDGEVETQTNGGNATTDARRTATPAPAHASDGGSAASDIRSPLDDDDDGGAGSGAAKPNDAGVADTYCGNCAHFEYVRTGEGIQPYCGYHDELMDDMEACAAWTSRRSE